MSRKIISGIRPTRIEMLRLKRQEVLAQKGHDLLEEKLDAMVMAFLGYRQPYLEQKKRVEDLYLRAMKTLIKAEMVMGTRTVDEAALSSPPFPDIPMQTRMMMGVQVPLIPLPESPAPVRGYSILGTSVILDESCCGFEELTREILRLAELEGTVTRLGQDIRRTRRRVNALERILLPRLKATIRYIEMHLEEREREDQFRRKRTKQLLKGDSL